MKKMKVLLFIGMLMFSNSLIASVVSFSSVDQAVLYGLENNPLIKAQAQNVEAKKYLPRKLGSLADPKIGVRLNGAPAKDIDYSFDQERIFINQSFPFFGELDRKAGLAKNEVAISELDLEILENSVALAIKTLYYDLILNRELIEITKKNIRNLENIISIADIKYRAGKTLQANVLKAKVTNGKLEEMILNLEHQKLLLKQELKKSLGLSGDKMFLLELAYPNKNELLISTPDESVISEALILRREVAMKMKSEQVVLVEKDRYLPDFSAQIEYWNNSGMEDQYSGQFAMTIPWFNNKNEASLRAAEFLSISKSNKLINTRNNIRSLIITLLSDLRTTKETIKLYDAEIIKNAKLSLSSFQKAFEVDRAFFLEYFESEKILFSIEMDYAKLVNRKYILKAKINSLFEKGE
jgi:outer membrane protein, heavy metal efflux system